ncbi:MAG: MarR family transcriptional regulator [Geminicoccaceae bacterium]|jgi:DNA-binding MarR family transcriptional regulator|nr:MarR family transcriptional regulator [Geminicoccaceae bacterium]
MTTIFDDAVEPLDGPALLREMARLHVRAQRATLACEGASATACTILTELGRAPVLTLAQLARRLRLDKGWTSRAVDQLVEDGLVAKGAGDDRRTIALSLTRAGRAEHRRIERLLNAQVARVFDRVPAAQRPAVIRAIETLHAAYLAELAEGSSAAKRPTAAAAS